MASETEKKNDGGPMGLIAALALVAIIGGGAGFSLQILIPDLATKAIEGPPVKTPGADGNSQIPANNLAKREVEAEKEQLVPLEPIVVTLADGKGVRLRLEGSVIFVVPSKTDRVPLVREMAQDLLTFLRTLKLEQVETASGLEYLRDDLTELVQLRSKGQARGLLLRSLMIE